MLQLFAGDLRLDEARQQRFASLQDCFTRELKAGARPVAPEPDSLVSPCDGEVMAAGGVSGGRLIQAKGLGYELAELIGDAEQAADYRDGVFVTLRLRANMYHRFHAPEAGCLDRLRALGAEPRNVNPPATLAIPRLYCRNFRVVLPLQVAGLNRPLLLIPVAAVGVASLKIHGLDQPLGTDTRVLPGLRCHHRFDRGDELGYFLQGSTIVVVAPRAVTLAAGVSPGVRVSMGRSLLRRRSVLS